MEKGGLNNSTQNQVEMRLICSNCLQFFQTVSAFGIVWRSVNVLETFKLFSFVFRYSNHGTFSSAQ